MNRIEKTFINAGIDDHLTIIKSQYALEIIKNEAIKTAILIVVFFIIGYIQEFILSVIILFPLRFASGGMHLKTNIGCLIFSFAFFILSILILPLIEIPIMVLFSFLSASMITIIILSPVVSYKRPIKAEGRRASLKRSVIIILSMDSVIVFILWFSEIHTYFVIGVWVVTLQAIQLLAAWIYRKEKGVENVAVDQKVEAVTDWGSRD